VRFDHVSSSIDGATLSLLVVACRARGALACGGFGFARNTAATRLLLALGHELWRPLCSF